MSRIGLGSINRANLRALWRIVKSFAFYALRRVDDIRSLALGDSVHGAFWFAGSAADALVRNFIRHVFPPEIMLENIKQEYILQISLTADALFL
jgi:hypothetical protein